MIPPNSEQAPDDVETYTQEFDPNTLIGNAVMDRFSPEKFPLHRYTVGEDKINGIRKSEYNEILYDERMRTIYTMTRHITHNQQVLVPINSMDLPYPDSPASTIMTDSGEELTDDEDQQLAEQLSDALPERALGNSKLYCHYTERPPDIPSKRRPIHEDNAFHQSTEQNFTITKDKIIEFTKEFYDKFLIKKELMASIIVIIFLCTTYNLVLTVNEVSPKSMQYYLYEEILNQYPTQDKRELKNLIRIINDVNQGRHESDKVAVITILYSHRETAECLAKTTATYAVRVINRNVDFVRLNGSLNNVDFHLGNENFRKDIEGKGVLVVYDFHNFPAEKVRYFHGICDKHTPYIEDKAVYIILLEMSKNQEIISKKLEKVQSRIEELWSNLNSEILYPLGVRLMDNVMVVHQEPKLLC